ncbi:MAG: hypothetical protein FWD24_05100 [Treponema sp.]|nr:hypothetical protein [Treponema sp.]
MRKLLFVLLAFLAVFTYIRAFDGAENEEKLQTPAEILIENIETEQWQDIDNTSTL